MLRKTFLSFALVLSSTSLPFAAEYQGHNIDGHVYDATVYSYDAGQYYNVSVEFDGDDAIIFFPKGGSLRLALDDQEIDDPHNISAYDYNKSAFWDIDVDGLD